MTSPVTNTCFNINSRTIRKTARVKAILEWVDSTFQPIFNINTNEGNLMEYSTTTQDVVTGVHIQSQTTEEKLNENNY